MNTIQEMWATFEQHVVPPDAGKTQREEMRRSFYAGASSVLSLTVTLTEMSDDAGVHALETLHEECRLFAAEVR